MTHEQALKIFNDLILAAMQKGLFGNFGALDRTREAHQVLSALVNNKNSNDVKISPNQETDQTGKDR